jgi:hypothetical protein
VKKRECPLGFLIAKISKKNLKKNPDEVPVGSQPEI